MAVHPDITPELCRQLLRYEPETGKLYWRERPENMFSDSLCHGGIRTAQWAADCWNCKHAGREAFTATNESGYRVGAILNRNFRAHRVIWAITHGEWPEYQIDHRDGVRANNRLGNLRAATNLENHKNEGRPINNTSGVTGVCWCKQTGRWRASIKVNYKQHYLGRFNSITEAAAAREIAKTKFGFTDAHGAREGWRP